MLSYRHAFHAGNHADVLKHCVLICLLRHLARKDKPFWVIDTHAGAGAYALDAGFASQNMEWAAGIGRLWGRTDLPMELADYVQQVRAINPDGHLRHYPGSPYLAWRLLRPQDRLRLFELHPTDAELLAQNLREAGRQALLSRDDGFAGLKALLPPAPRRGVVLLDPPYEDKRDYIRAAETLKDSLKRFATGVYALWYPLLARTEAQRLSERLRALPASWLEVTLHVDRPPRDGFGMYGSGLFIINPPWSVQDSLHACLPVLQAALAQGPHARYQITTSTP
ncbi:MAG TPA: 23S rRNA (adenine(2030)-N(6))-methyltransferase RlmJ [Thiobacillaceae bacterium]|nr:23S rRNA (adenine(2030)-N(6))-methyltransferase RlmJ [Thiobacillaceae bacterium]HNU63761.1 23S rRNA (adenine(2030)-N(6))-methyltransferase RlmJ [Thiobacillaceae bacterium]